MLSDRSGFLYVSLDIIDTVIHAIASAGKKEIPKVVETLWIFVSGRYRTR